MTPTAPQTANTPTFRRPPLIHVAQMVFNVPLAILPDKLEVILSALGPRLVANPSDLSEILLKTPNFANFTSPAAFDDSDFDENRQKSTKPYSITDSGVAIIPVKGVLMKKGGWLASASGCSTYSGVTSAVSAAMDDLIVKGILLDVDSPGGTTHGCFECADALYAYRGQKPMYAVANDLAASAAYAITSSAERIFLTRTAGVGSIGVFSLHTEQSAADEQLGVTYTYIYAGAHKVDGNPHEPLSQSAYSSIKTEVDRQYAIFIATVARNRNRGKSALIDTKAEVWSADRAMPLLADAVGTYDDALSALTARLTNKVSVIMVHSTAQPVQPAQGDSTMSTAANPLTAADLSALIAAEVQKAVTASLPGIITGVSASLAAAKPSKDDDNDKKDEPDDDEDDKKKDAKGKSARAAAASEEDNDDGKNDKKKDKNADDYGKKAIAAAVDAAVLAANNATVEITDLCGLSGHPELLSGFLSKRTPVADVRKTLHELRAKESAATSVSSSFGTVSTEALSTISQQTDALVATSGGTLSRAVAMMRLLKRNPKLYNQYENERRVALLSPNGIEQYAYHVQQQASAFDLSSELGQFGPKEQIGGGGVVK